MKRSVSILVLTGGLGLYVCTARGDVSEGYQLLDSITSTGTQWINTLYTPNADTEVEAHFNTRAVTTGWGIYFGCSSNDRESPDGFQLRRDGKSANLTAWVGGGRATQASEDNTDVKVKLSGKGFRLGRKTASLKAKPYAGKIPLYLFAGYCGNPLVGVRGLSDREKCAYRPQAMRLYSLRISEKGVLKRDFVPARQFSTGRLGLLDLVAYRQDRATGFYANESAKGGDFKPGIATNSVLNVAAKPDGVRYEANWESLDRRPVQQWYKDAKFGVIIHWGPYAVPAYAPPDGERLYYRYSEQYKGRMDIGVQPFVRHHAEKYHNAPYANFAAEFKAENYDPAEWADLFKRAGIRYAALTSVHFDGFTLWPSPLRPYYNSVAMGPGRDLAGEFMGAMRAAGIKCGFYYSVREPENPVYREALKNGTLSEWSLAVNHPQMKDLVERYKIDILCPDGEWTQPDTDWKSVEFLQWLYNESSVRDTIVVSDRWGKGCRGKHGGYWTTEYGMCARPVDTAAVKGGMPQEHPWEEWRGIGWSFGWNKFERAEHYMSEKECLETLVWCVSGGGNLMLDVGPTDDGRIPVIMQDRLLAMGRWLDVNGEAIYGSRIWWTKDYKSAKANHLYFTRQGETVYAITFRWPDASRPITMHDVGKVKGVTLVGADGAKVDWREEGGTLTFSAAPLAPDTLPCAHAWTFRIKR